MSTPLFQWSLLYGYYNSNFFSKWFKNILRTLEAEIAQNSRTPSFNLKNVVLIKKMCILETERQNLTKLDNNKPHPSPRNHVTNILAALYSAQQLHKPNILVDQQLKTVGKTLHVGFITNSTLRLIKSSLLHVILCTVATNRLHVVNHSL